MKKLILFFTYALAVFSFNAHAYPTMITQHMTGSWYNPDQNGHGFNLEVYRENRSVFYWYVYNPDGTPTWLVGRGTHNGLRIEGIAYHNTGMVWGEFDPLTRTQTRWGTVTIEFTGCDRALVTYQSDDQSEQAIPYGSGSFEIHRLTYMHKSRCTDVPHIGIYKGYLYSNGSEELYPLTALLDENNALYGYAFDYKTFMGSHPAVYTDNQFFGEGTAYVNSTKEPHAREYTMAGEIATDYRLYAEFTIPEVDSGWVDLYPVNQQFYRSVTLTELAGDYLVEDLYTFDEGTATIDADGAITGTDATGCALTGQITLAENKLNMFSITVTVSECGDDNAQYTGMGFLDDAAALEDGNLIWFLAPSYAKAYGFRMERITQ